MQKGKRIHYYWLDLLRFLSALIVVIAHCRANFFQIFCNLESEYQTLGTKIFYLLCSFSDDGVLIFFILSGFLVGGVSIDKIINREKIDDKLFALNRSIRILLPLAFSLLLAVIVHFINGTPNNYLRVLGNLLSLQGVFCESEGGIMWTMPYIVWFYVFIYSLILLSNSGRYKIFLGCIFMCISLSLFTALSTHEFFVLSFGVLAYFLSKIKIDKRIIFCCIVVAILTALATKFAKPSISRSASFLSTLSVPVLNVVEAFSLSIIISQIVRYKPTGKMMIELDKISTNLSKFSYSLYLVHIQVISLLLFIGFPYSKVIDFKSISFFILAILLCLFGGYVAYLMVEKHTDKIKKYIIRKI